jgi:transposase-like protein
MEMSVSMTVPTFLSRTALSDTVLEELMAERGITVDHSTEHRRALKLLPIPSPQPASMRRSIHPA